MIIHRRKTGPVSKGDDRLTLMLRRMDSKADV